MNPIDKFTNIDAVYPTTDAREEDIILDCNSQDLI